MMNYFYQTIQSKLLFVALIGFLTLSTVHLFAQDVTYTDSWGNAGYTLKTSDHSGLKINFSVSEFSFTDAEIDGVPMQNILLPGTLLPNDEGAPDLPGTSRFVAVPQGATPKLIIKDYRIEKFQNVNMAPAPRIPLETEDGPLDFNKNPDIYSQDAFYPANPIQISDLTQIRGIDAVMLGITPFQYNPVTKELIVYRDVEVEISFEGSTGHFGEDRLRSRWWDPIIQDAFINSALIPEMDYNKMRQQITNSTDNAGCEYLIVIPNNPEFKQWADSIRLFRQKQGISTDIITLDEIGTNTVNGLKSYFSDAYNTWDIPPAAILLLADYGSNASNSITSPIWDNYCASDNIFSDVNNDDMPDMIFARITANNYSQLEVMVTKFLNYERTPPTDPDFYNHPITALGWQTERWFQICSETIGGYWRSLGKDPVRINAIYAGTPGSIWSSATNTGTVVNYFGPNGLDYIPQTPAELGGWNGGTEGMVIDAINNGSFALQHRDHGYEQGWGEPDFNSSSINSLGNTDLCFIFSINCLTGKYNMSGECFTEKFHRHTKNGENAGALGLIAASEVSYSFVNDTYVWGMYDNMWPDFMPNYGMPVDERGLLPAFANAAGKYFLKQSQWPYNTGNKEVTYNLFHHHGDAFLTVYSEVPQDLGVTHNSILYSGETSFTVSANPGSYIALTVDGEIIGTAEGTGFPATISIEAQIPESQIIVTVTKQNYYRHESVVEVIPPAGSYVVFNAYDIDDMTGGNGNGMMDYAEQILLDMTVKNVGVEMTEIIEVTISGTSEYITVTNAVSDFGTIGSNETKTVEGAFGIQVHNNIPDLEVISFELAATDGTDTWTSSFTITGHAPVFEISGDVMVSDPDGNNNGRLDPGETADIHVPTMNIGSGNAYTVHSAIMSGSPFIVFNSVEYNLDMIEAGSVGYAVFNVSLHEQAVIGTLIETTFNTICDATTIEQNVMLKVGATLEDFETGDLSLYPWQNGGSSPWFITDQVAYEGSHSLQSGAVNDGQMCILGLSANIMLEDSVSFYRKTSTETGDVLQFFIDGAMLGEWSGEHEWEYFSYPVTTGNHNLIWRFYKDNAQVAGDDAVWVDLIEFPTLVNNDVMAFAGQDANICAEDIFQSNAAADNYESLMWTTSGTGTFDDNATLNPIYTPSADDLEMGYVMLSLTAYDGGDEESDEMMLTLMNVPGYSVEPPVGEYALCLNPGTISYTVDVIEGAEEYIWVIIPEEAGTITWEGTEAEVAYDPEFLGNSDIKVKGINDCGEGDWSTYLPITIWTNPDPVEMPIGPTEVCAGEDEVVYEINSVLNVEEIVWELDPAEAGTLDAGSLLATVSWSAEFGGDATLRAKPINYCAEGEWSEALVVNVVPMPVAAGNIDGQNQTCVGSEDTYLIPEITNSTTYEWAVEPEVAGVATINNMECTIAWDENWNGDATLKVRGMNDCAEGEWSEALVVNVAPMPMAAGTIEGKDKTCMGSQDNYTIPEIANSSSFEWVLEPEDAGMIIVNNINMDCTIEWDENWNGDATLKVRGMNDCGEGEWSEVFSVLVQDCTGIDEIGDYMLNIYPNPNKGLFTITLDAQDIVDVKLYGVTGKLMYSKDEVNLGGTANLQIDATHLPGGIYYLTVKGDEVNSTEKVEIRK